MKRGLFWLGKVEWALGAVPSQRAPPMLWRRLEAAPEVLRGRVAGGRGVPSAGAGSAFLAVAVVSCRLSPALGLAPDGGLTGSQTCSPARVPSRLNDTVGAGALEEAGLLLTPLSAVCGLPLRKAPSRSLLPSNVPCCSGSPETHLQSAPLHRQHTAGPSAPAPSSTPTSSGAAVAPAGACGEKRADRSGSSRPGESV